MKNLWILLFLLTAVPVLAQQNSIEYAQPVEYEIGGIDIEGPKYLDKAILRTFSGLTIGDKISIPGEEIPNAIKALWKQDLFADVKIEASKIVGDVIFLQMTLQELPRLSKYKFSGVRKSEVDAIRDLIPLVAGKVVSQNIKDRTIQKIKDYYGDKAFLNCEVLITEQPDAKRPNRVVLNIDVERNNKVRIDEIYISGNEHVHSRKLKKKLSDTKEKTKISPKAPLRIVKDLFKRNPVETLANVSVADAMDYVDDKIRVRLFSTSKFDEDNFEADKDNLINYYNSLGYRDARITRDSVYFTDDKNLVIELNVDEGQKYYFREIKWVGNTKHEDDVLAQRLGIKRGETYNKDLLDRRLFMDPEGGDVSSLYMDDGYLFFNVTPVETLVEGDSIDLQMRVYEGPEATINRIIIRGNEMTNENVVRRTLRTKPGSKFRRSDIIRSQREIATLGFFNPETISINPIPNPVDGTVDIEYTVEEKPSDQLQLSAGWGGTSVFGNVGLSFNNFSLKNILKPELWRPLPKGDGQTLSVNFISNGRRYQSISTAFTEPWLGGKRPVSFTVAFNHARQASYLSTDSTTPFQLLRNTSGTVEIGKRLRWPDDYFTLIGSLNYSHYKLENWSNFIVTDGRFNVFSLKGTLSRSSVDAPIYPRSGSLFTVSLEMTPPYSAFSNKDYSQLSSEEKFKFPEFHKWKVKAEWYTNIVGNLVLKTSAKMGFLGYYNSDLGYAPFERFQVGGDGLSNSFNQIISGLEIISLRGYDQDEITINQVPVNDSQTLTTSVGDPFYNKFTAELRYPFSLNPSSTIYALAFLEAGNSWNTFDDYNPFELRRSTGMGLRVFLPMFGMLGFDYGVGFDKNLSSDGSIGNFIGTFGRFSFILGFEPE